MKAFWRCFIHCCCDIDNEETLNLTTLHNSSYNINDTTTPNISLSGALEDELNNF